MRKSEQVQCLIDEMRSKIKPQSRARTWVFAPALAHDRTKAIQMGLIVGYFAEHVRLQNGLRRKNFAIPSPVVEDRKEPVMLSCNLCERSSLSKRHGKRFIDDNIFPCAQSSGGKRKMALIRAGDHDEIDVRVCGHFRSGADNDSRVFGLQDLAFARSHNA